MTEFNQVNLDDLKDVKQQNSCLSKIIMWPIHAIDIAEWVIYFILSLIQCIIFVTLLQDLDDSDLLESICLLEIVTPFTTAVYGSLMIKVRLNFLVSIGIGLLGLIFPGIWILVLLYTQSDDYFTIVCCSYSICVVFYFAIIRSMRQTMGRNYNHIRAGIVTILLYALLPFGLQTGIVYSILDSDAIDLDLLQKLIYISTVPYIMIIIIGWCFVHFVYYKNYDSEMDNQVYQTNKDKITDLAVQTVLASITVDLPKSDQTCWHRFQAKVYLFSSIIQLLVVLLMEGGCIVQVILYIEGDADERSLYLSLFYIPAIPAFVIGGNVVSLSRLNTNDKYCTFPLFYTVIAAFCMIPVFNIMYSYDSLIILAYLVGIGLPFGAVYWLSLMMLQKHDKKGYQFLVSFSCLVIVAPLFYLIPYYLADTMQDSTFWIIFSLLFIGGFIILTIFYAIDLFKGQSNGMQNFKAKMQLFWLKLKGFDGFDLSMWIYTCTFLFGICILAACVAYTYDFADDSSLGYTVGSFLLFIYCLILSIIVHRVQVFAREIGKEEPTLTEIITQRFIPKSQIELKYFIKKRRFQKLIIVISALMLLSFAFLPFLSGVNDMQITAMIVVLVSGLVIMLIFLLLLECKNIMRRYGKIAISYSISLWWLFIMIPLYCLVPTTLTMAQDNQELHKVSSWTIGFVCFQIMCFVIVISISLNIIFRRMEYEKIAKYCCMRLRQLLNHNGVVSKMTTLRIIFDQFVVSTPESLKTVLKAGTSIYYTDIRDVTSESGIVFTKEVLSVEEINKQISGVDSLEQQDLDYVETNTYNCNQCLWNVCTTKDYDQRVQIDEEFYPEELAGLQADQLVNISDIQEESYSRDQDTQLGDQMAIQVTPNEERSSAWGRQLKTLRNAFTKYQKRLQDHRQNILNKLQYTDPLEPEDNNENIDDKPVTEQDKAKLTQTEHFQKLRDDLVNRKEWYELVHNRFANGLIHKTPKPWTTLHDLRQFIRLTGLKQKVPNVSCDLLYVKLTRRYSIKNSKKVYRKIDFDLFYEELLSALALLVYPRLGTQEALERLFSEYIYPNLVTNLPYLGKRDKVIREKRSNSMLNLGGMLLLQNNKVFPMIIQEPNPQEPDIMQLNQTLRSNLDSVRSNNFVIEENADGNIKNVSQNEDQQSISHESDPIHRQGTYVYNNGKFVFSSYNAEQQNGKCRQFNNCMNKFLKCIASIPYHILRCLKVIVGTCGILVNPTPVEPDRRLEAPPTDEEFAEFLENVKEEITWEEIIDLSLNGLQTFYKQAKEIIQQPTDLQMDINLQNLIFIFGHIIEVITFMSLAFASQVGWFVGDSATSEVSDAALAQTNYWEETFWIAFTLCCIFIILAPFAIHLSRLGRLGLTKDMRPAKFPHWEFFLGKIMNLMGRALYLTIMKTMLDVFSCEFDQTNDAWYLMRNDKIDCFQEEHSLYLVLGGVGVLLYYPAATLLLPNLQYQDKTLDLKFDTSYIVAESQGKLIIAGVAAFFAKEKYILLQLGISFIVCLILAIITIFAKPCLVKSYNIWKAGGYCIAAWACGWAFLNIATQQTELCFTALWGGIIFGIIVLIVIQIKVYGCSLSKLKNIKAVIQGKQIDSEWNKEDEQH